MDRWAGAAFSNKYDIARSDWGGSSGGGSSPLFIGPYRIFLEQFLHQNNIKSVLDVGCGDWQFSRMIDWHSVDYLGLDVVEQIVMQNERRYATPKCRFDLMPQDVNGIKPRDLLIMKDVLQHLSDVNIKYILDTLVPKFKYCLITNSYEKISSAQNIDIVNGEFRCLDLSAQPYNLRGCYVLEFGSQLWERLRTYLVMAA